MHDLGPENCLPTLAHQLYAHSVDLLSPLEIPLSFLRVYFWVPVSPRSHLADSFWLYNGKKWLTCTAPNKDQWAMFPREGHAIAPAYRRGAYLSFGSGREALDYGFRRIEVLVAPRPNAGKTLADLKVHER
jgi:hypothetical protein